MVCKSNRRTWSTWQASWSYFSRLFVLILSVLFTATIASGQASQKKNVLIITEVGLSHSLISSTVQQIAGGVRDTPDRHVEFYTESLDLMSFPSRPSRKETRDWLDKKYGQYKLDVVVAVGPQVVNFLSNYTQSLFLEVPIVICGTTAGQLGNPRLDSRFTGTWMKLEPERTLEVALRLFPNTRHVFVVGGSSDFDKAAISLTKAALRSFNTKAEILYLTEMEMGTLLKQLQDLPDHSIVLYTSFFQDSAGNKFINATKALPAIAAASNAPDFGMSDTYLGHGIVGGHVMPFEKQAKITAQIVSQLLDGKKVQELPIETIPSVYMFDWHQLQSWHISESRLPSGSVILFREPSLWERYKWTWAAVLAIILGLSGLAAYLQYSRTQLKLARERQTQLSGMLISAEEQERSRIASELHDDFSQRLALLAIGLENAAEAIPVSPNEASRQLHELVNSTSEIGADLHTLSHRLHSSTLESLGLVPAVAALCKEFGTQQEVKVNFISADVPHSVDPNAALCIFRIVQEGLRNLKKHSGVREALVNLRQTDDRLEVSVRDRGRGFNPSDLRQSKGIGIRSMEERARQLGGKFEIYSVPGKGTSLEAWVPLKPARGHPAS
jgi:signal transduction histidine kinase